MVLSSGTLNLKFMQRAAARNPAPTPTATSSTSTHLSTPTPGPSKLPLSTSISKSDTSASTPSYPSQVGTSEQWFMPKRSSPKSQPSSSSTSISDKWTFEQSYMPFLGTTTDPNAQNTEIHIRGERSTQTSSQSGGGRRNFGYGDEKQKEETEGLNAEGQEEEEEGVDGERKLLEELRADSDSDVKTSTVEIRKGKRGFIKPRGFDSPLKQQVQEHKPKVTSTSTGSTTGRNAAGPSTDFKVNNRSETLPKKRKNPPQSHSDADAAEAIAPQPRPVESVMTSEIGRNQKKKQAKKALTLDEREKEVKEASRRKKMEIKRRKKEERQAQTA